MLLDRINGPMGAMRLTGNQRLRLGPPPRATSAAVSRSMRSNVAKNTGPEIKLRGLFREAGFRGYRLNWKGALGRPDIVFPKQQLAVFVHGCYWHRCPYCRLPLPKSHRAFWRKKFFLNRRRDRRKEAALQEAGWKCVVVWECYLKPRKAKHLQRALAKIRRHLRR